MRYNAAVPDLPVCVYCRRRPAESQWRPVCSQRCQLLDLAHWVDGDYRVPGEHNAHSFDLFSYGADGTEGGEGPNADVTNWDTGA